MLILNQVRNDKVFKIQYLAYWCLEIIYLLTMKTGFLGISRYVERYGPKPCREREGFKGREKPRFGVGGFPSPLMESYESNSCKNFRLLYGGPPCC